MKIVHRKIEYPECLLKKIRFINGLNPDDNSRDHEFKNISPADFLSLLLKFDHIDIENYEYTIMVFIEYLWGVNLFSHGGFGYDMEEDDGCRRRQDLYTGSEKTI